MDDEIDWGGYILAGILVLTFTCMGVMGIWTARDLGSCCFTVAACTLGCGMVLYIMKEPAPNEFDDYEDPPA